MKFMKRTLSIVLAVLMLFSTMSVLASATLNDGKQSSITFDTKFYRYDGSDWVETTKAARGEKIKIRTFWDTDFVLSYSKVWFLYDKAQLEFDPSGYTKVNASYEIISNQGLKASFAPLPDDDIDIQDLIEYDLVSEDVFERFSVLSMNINSGAATKITSDKWIWEFDFIVKDDATDFAQMIVHKDTFVYFDNIDTEFNPVYFGRIPDEAADGETMVTSQCKNSMTWQIQPTFYDQDEDSTLTFTNAVKFDAGKGTFANGTSAYTTSEGFIGEALSASDKPTEPTLSGSSFVGWLPSSVDASTATAADCVALDSIKYNYTVDTYTALYEESESPDPDPTTYEFKFDANGGKWSDESTTKTVEALEGEAVSVTAPSMTGYNFKGWAPATVANPTASDVVTLPASASEGASYKAVWEKATYTVKWIVDGDEKGMEYVLYGDPIPEAPVVTKEGYTIKWSEAPAAMPATSLEIVGTWEANEYTVTWTDGKDFTTTTKVKYGEPLVAPDYTAPAGYDFVEWKNVPATMPANESLAITAELKAKTYTVTWKVDGVTVGTTTETYGQPLNPPTGFVAPDDKYFDGWTDKPDTMPDNENLVVNGTWADVQKYTVTYYYEDGVTVYKSESLEPGKPLTKYDDPRVYGSVFVRWDKDIPDVMPENDLDIVAIFNDIDYTIIFTNPEGAIEENHLHYNDVINAPEDTDCFGYTFDGTWTYNGEPITFPTTVKDIVGENDAEATFEFVGDYTINKYKVTFYLDDDAEVPYGEPKSYDFDTEISTESIDFPEDPTKPGYTFTGWDYQEGELLEDDLDIIGQWTPKKYNVSFRGVPDESVNWDEINLEYDSEIADFDADIGGYTFNGWTYNGKTITLPTTVKDIIGENDDVKDIVLVGNYVPDMHKVSFYLDYEAYANGATPLSAVDYAYDTSYTDITVPTGMKKLGYTFDSWSDDLTDGEVTSDMDIYGIWEAKQYNVSFTGVPDESADWDLSNLEYDSEIADFDASVNGYTFNGWTYNGTTITLPTTVKDIIGENDDVKDIVLVGNYTKNAPTTYEIKFEDGSGNTLLSGNYAEGAAITAPTDKVTVPDGMVFDGWYDDDGNKFDGTAPAANTTYKPKLVNSTSVAYAIEIYLEDLDGKYELAASSTLTGTNGATASTTPGSVTGFTLDSDESVLSAVIKGDGTTKLVVKYSRNSYTATFDGAPYTVKYGAALPEVTPDAVTGKEFKGWVDASGKAAPATMPAEAIALTSDWDDVIYTITYIVDGKSTVDKYAYGEKVTKPSDPVADDKVFVKWSGNLAGIPDRMPAEDLVFVAVFETTGKIDAYTVKFWTDDTVYEANLVMAGATISLPTGTPTKDNYIFKGWKNVPATMPEHDIDIYAEFERVPVVLVPKDSTVTTVIDRDAMLIYGLEERMTKAKYNDYLAVEGDGYFTVTSTAIGYGTGTVIKLYDNVTNKCIETYYVVIFGDINGDAVVDSTDVSMATDETASVTKWSLKQKYSSGNLVDNDKYVACMAKAADLNGDGIVSSNDVYLIYDVSLSTSVINQVTGTVTAL